MTKDKKLLVYMSEDLKARLQEYAYQKRLSMNEVVRVALEKEIDEIGFLLKDVEGNK